MATIFDAAKFILESSGSMTAMKLQKLMYYSQAWNLVWEEEPIFADDFQAWANGPVLPALYARHKGMFKVESANFADGNIDAIAPGIRDNITKVLGFYGTKTAQWLSNVSHQETPWLAARGDLPPGQLSDAVIEKAAMHEYYSSL